MTQQRDVVPVPIRTELRGSTYLVLEREAAKRSTTVGSLVAAIVDVAVHGKPRPAKRSYVHITADHKRRILQLHAQGLKPSAIAAQIGCSAQSVRNHIAAEVELS